MNSPAVDIASYLDGISSLALTFATDLFVGKMPDEDASDIDIACVFDPPGGTRDAKQDIRTPSVQVLVRGKRGGYQTGYALIASIADELHGQNDLTISGARYIHILQEGGGIMFLQFDEKKRPMFSVNFTMLRTPTS